MHEEKQIESRVGGYMALNVPATTDEKATADPTNVEKPGEKVSRTNGRCAEANSFVTTSSRYLQSLVRRNRGEKRDLSSS